VYATPTVGLATGPDRPRTAAELAADVEPKDTSFPEGDLRRYGGDVSALDNSGAINEALLVSANGGNAAFVPNGTWRTTKPLRPTLNSSLFGVGSASIIAPQANDGIIFGNGGDYSKRGLCRFFRDFQLVGANADDSSYKGIVVDFSAKSTARVNGVLFENIFVANFAIGVYARGFWFTTFSSCHFYNCYHGIYFMGQNIANSVLNCTVNRGTIRGQGGAWGISFQTTEGESTESTRILSGLVYAYDININAALAFELQIEHVDLSAAQSIGVQIIGTIGGCWVRDCWIETLNSAPTIGIKVASIQPSTYTLVHLVGNHINCDTPNVASQGIVTGFSNSGIVVSENAVIGFDQGMTLGASSHAICKHNRINCITSTYSPSSHGVFLDSLASDNDVGPNEIVPGKPQSARMRAAEPTIGVEDSRSLPIGTPVQFDTTANGFSADVTYFILSSASNSITVGSENHAPPIVASAGKSMRIFAAPVPIVFSVRLPRNLSLNANGSFVLKLSGFDSRVEGVVKWVINGRFVALSPAQDGLTGTSNSPQMIGSGLPDFLRPTTPQVFAAQVQDDGATLSGAGTVRPDGSIVFFTSLGLAEFKPSGRKGLGVASMMYVYQ
jgi:hypothetical protein